MATAVYDLHKAQISVLSTLRHAHTARYSDLMRPTGLDSDVFKFHLRKLVKQGYVVKTSAGDYTLTATGKEFANNLDKRKRSLQKQPKHSLLLIVKKVEAGDSFYLFQERQRQPHWGYWGFISGPLQWGIDAELVAGRELEKQTGLSADFHVAAFCRQRDYEAESGKLLEDKLFYVMVADKVSGSLSQAYSHGRNQWMTLKQLESQKKHFEPTRCVIEALEDNKTYISLDVERQSADF